jgi:hypothetical protein
MKGNTLKVLPSFFSLKPRMGGEVYSYIVEDY